MPKRGNRHVYRIHTMGQSRSYPQSVQSTRYCFRSGLHWYVSVRIGFSPDLDWRYVVLCIGSHLESDEGRHFETHESRRKFKTCASASTAKISLGIYFLRREKSGTLIQVKHLSVLRAFHF